MEKILQQLLDGQKQLFDGQKQLFEEVRQIKTTLDENVQITKGLVNWTEEINAQVHGMGHTLARVEGKVNQLEKQQGIIKADVSFLTRKAAEQDEAMYRLQQAK